MGEFLSKPLKHMACSSSSTAVREEESPPTIAILGLKEAGKTTIMYQLLKRDPPPYAKHYGYVMEHLHRPKGKAILIKVNAHARKFGRPWTDQLPICNGLIWVIDSHDKELWRQSGEQLKVAMSNLKTLFPPLLILANKFDLLESDADLASVANSTELDLQNFETGVRKLLRCCATTAAGLEEGIAWLEAQLPFGGND